MFHQPNRNVTTSPIGSSPGLLRQVEIAQSVASRESTVLILGESGTGKELLARYVHNHSVRSAGPFIPIDCTNLTPSLFESQLFGHTKGAFTGAVSDSQGMIQSADGGTLFLDEMGELVPEMQARFLRVLQDHQVWPVGAKRPVDINIRVIAATNKDLWEATKRGAFREDLYYRLAVVVIEMPPLRERPEDILPLARHFLDALSAFYEEDQKTLDAEVAETLRDYAWPGNVRELSNVMERCFVLSRGNTITFEFLPRYVVERQPTEPNPRSMTLAEAEKHTIERALHETRGVKKDAAVLLGIDPRRLTRLMDRLQVGSIR